MEGQGVVIRRYADLHELLRARAEELNITRETIDGAVPLQAGYAGKLLAPKPMKCLGAQTLIPTLRTLGLMLVVVEDPAEIEQVAKLQRRERSAPAVHWRIQRAAGVSV